MNFMNDKFFDLKKEKQDRMINAALKYFALNGYQHASTDDIVREAAISKGLIFHYFESKIGLYEFVYEYSVRYLLLEQSAVCVPGQQLFDVMKQIEYARMQAMKGYPYMVLFLNRSMSENVGEALIAAEEKKELLWQEEERIDSLIDYGLLPPRVDGRKLRKMLDFTIKGLMAERFRDASFQPEMLYEEIVGYLEFARGMIQ